MVFQGVQQHILLKITQDFVFLCAHLKLIILVSIHMVIIQHGNVLLFALLEHKILFLITQQWDASKLVLHILNTMLNNTVEDVLLYVCNQTLLFQELFLIIRQENVFKIVHHHLIISLIIQREDVFFIVPKVH